METRSLTRREKRFLRRKRLSSKITIPSRVSPYVRLVFEEMRRQVVTYDEVEERSGVLRATIKAWRHRNKPGLESIEAVLGVLGWDFVPIPREKALPSDLVAELTAVAKRFEMTMAGTVEALVTLVATAHEKAPTMRVDAPATAPTLRELAAT